MSLNRGDIVLYNNTAYYFQPDGRSCLLYERKCNIGSRSKACWQPSQLSVTKAPEGTVVIYNPTDADLKEQAESAYRQKVYETHLLRVQNLDDDE